jgi:hypothetical protein
MTIRKWHPGQLVVLWIAAVACEWLLWQFWDYLAALETISSFGFATALFVLVAIAALPVAMFVVTWKWFGAKGPTI